MGNTKTKNNSKKPKQTSKTVATVQKQNTVEYVIVNILCLFVFIAFAYIAIMSFVQTSVFDSANYGSEVILYQTDNIALNILFTALFTVFIFKMKKHYDFFAKVNLKYMQICLAAFVMIVGLVWIFSVTSVPAADSYNIYETASQAAKGNYSSFQNNSGFYKSVRLNLFPFFCLPDASSLFSSVHSFTATSSVCALQSGRHTSSSSISRQTNICFLSPVPYFLLFQHLQNTTT